MDGENSSEHGDREQIVEEMLSRLTLDDKLSLLAGKGLFRTRSLAQLGLPAMKLVDGPRGIGWHSSLRRCTAFPTGIALGASWNPDLAGEFGVAMAREAIAVGAHVLLGPAVNICRTPLNGRTFEYLTEDPLLNCRLAVPLVRGIQSQGIAACIKHFAVNNQEAQRSRITVQVSERALREIYLPVFEAAVREADVWSVMAAYNGVNGDACCENGDLLQQRLRREYGFRGFVVSDWFAARRTRSGASCLKAGLNLEMPLGGLRYRRASLLREFKQGDFTAQEVDAALAPLLRVWSRTATVSRAAGQRNTPAHQELAYRMAAESITLLQNANQALPLDDTCQRIAVLGPRASKRNCRPLYGGSAGVWSPYEITPLQGIRDALGPGCRVVEDPSRADAAIVFAGLGHRVHGDCEGRDRQTMRLPAEQEQLIRETAAANPRTIVVLVSGSPLEMDWAEDVAAILMAWYPGMEGGRAIADIVFGKVNPSGKLPVTFPRSLGDSPAHGSERQYPGDSATVHYDEGVFVGYRHFDREHLDVLFPFGHGLSYTSFTCRDLAVNAHWQPGETLTVALKLENTGAVAGAEVVQLYLAPQAPRVPRPPQELKAFQKVFLQPGEIREVEFRLEEKALAYWCEQTNAWRCDPGQYALRLGASSRDTRLSSSVLYG
ncbi:glycoside hydrolase family 3 C-terminal domain-containing protein [Haliea sp. E17]|uniref:glycoside hydrolase family 3 C-terminal domain-containing protein n=1 Tax=Haliea sp. E17 TaxID=3401576 RepID=UPI003AAA2558